MVDINVGILDTNVKKYSANILSMPFDYFYTDFQSLAFQHNILYEKNLDFFFFY